MHIQGSSKQHLQNLFELISYLAFQSGELGLGLLDAFVFIYDLSSPYAGDLFVSDDIELIKKQSKTKL